MTAATGLLTSTSRPGRRPRRDDPRRAALRAARTSAACPDAVDRILTLTGRGELRMRSIVDEDGRRILRTLVNRALLAASVQRSLVVATLLLVAVGQRPDSRRRDRSVRDLRLRRPARRDACSCYGWSPPSPGMGRHDPDLRRDARTGSPTARRALLPPSGRRRASWCCGGCSPRSSRCSSRSRRAPATASQATSAAPPRRCRRPPASSCLRSYRLPQSRRRS